MVDPISCIEQAYKDAHAHVVECTKLALEGKNQVIKAQGLLIETLDGIIEGEPGAETLLSDAESGVQDAILLSNEVQIRLLESSEVSETLHKLLLDFIDWMKNPEKIAHLG